MLNHFCVPIKLKRTVMSSSKSKNLKQICVTHGCNYTAKNYFLFCESHKCDFAYHGLCICPYEKIPPSSFCQDHKCPDCCRVIFRNGCFCVHHGCLNFNCYNKRAISSEYCLDCNLTHLNWNTKD